MERISKASDEFIATLTFKRASITFLSAVFLFIFAPIVIYIGHFGLTISSSHSRWAEFGAAMSGIYSPIVAFATLFILYMQTTIQHHATNQNITFAFVNQASIDIAVYASELNKIMNGRIGTDTGPSVNSKFRNAFEIADPKLDISNIKAAAISWDQSIPTLFSNWSSVSAIIASLGDVKDPYREFALSSAKMKMVATLGFETCLALDVYSWALMESRDISIPQFHTKIPAGKATWSVPSEA